MSVASGSGDTCIAVISERETEAFMATSKMR
jgi:hypothetical protein